MRERGTPSAIASCDSPPRKSRNAVTGPGVSVSHPLGEAGAVGGRDDAELAQEVEAHLGGRADHRGAPQASELRREASDPSGCCGHDDRVGRSRPRPSTAAHAIVPAVWSEPATSHESPGGFSMSCDSGTATWVAWAPRST